MGRGFACSPWVPFHRVASFLPWTMFIHAKGALHSAEGCPRPTERLGISGLALQFFPHLHIFSHFPPFSPTFCHFSSFPPIFNSINISICPHFLFFPIFPRERCLEPYCQLCQEFLGFESVLLNTLRTISVARAARGMEPGVKQARQDGLNCPFPIILPISRPRPPVPCPPPPGPLWMICCRLTRGLGFGMCLTRAPFVPTARQGP